MLHGLDASGTEHGTGITQLHVIGLGGVGKSQLVTEYAYRYDRNLRHRCLQPITHRFIIGVTCKRTVF